MGQFIIAHTTLHIVTTPIAIAVFLGLAIYVITCNPRRPISWVFSFLCLMIASIYLSSLFTTSELHVSFSISDFLIHWKWVAIALSSTVYLHLVFFYFLPTWRRYHFWTLLLVYLFNAGLAFMTLFTDLLVSGHLYHPVPHFANSIPGSFEVFYVGFFVLEMAAGLVGLLVSYRSTRSPSFRQQIIYLLITTAMALSGSIIYWLTILTDTTDEPSHLLPEMLLILTAVLYTRAVVRYGSFVGRPLARRSLFYSTLATVAGLTTLYLTVSLDQWLMNHTPLPYYLVTGIFVLIVATGFPTISQWITDELDKWFFQTEHQQQKLARCMAEALAEAPDSAQLQVELLDTLCAVLGTANGYVALASPDLPPDKLAVQLVRGDLSLQPGDLVRRPPLYGKEPQLVAALLPQPPAEPGWQDMALFCPLTMIESLEGVLALGEKRNKTPFRLPELLFCAELIKQLALLKRPTRLRLQHRHYLQAARLQEQTLRQLTEEATPLSSQALPSWESDTAPIEIRVLGPLQVTCQGQVICEAAWGSEKAKGLLAYLLWKSPRGVTREELSNALWPDRAVGETANVFHVTLHRLRRVFQVEPSRPDKGLSYIEHDRGYYRFNLEAPHWLDLMAFQSLVASDNPASLQAAVNLYRGSYLEDMAWALPVELEAERRHFEQLYTDALRRLAALGNDGEALYYLEKLLAVEPADETAHRALTLGYLARGRGDLARRQVRRWQQALSEFDLEASAETKLFWQSVETKNNQPR